MNSTQTNESANNSVKSLIEWSSPEFVKDKTYDGSFFNNPFDVLELKAANMDPFDLVPNQTPYRIEPPCSNMLSPLWDPKNRQIQKSVSLTNLDGVAKVLQQNYIENVEANPKDQSKDVDSPCMDCVDKEIIDGLENNCVPLSVDLTKEENNKEKKNELVSTPDYNEGNVDNLLCNEEEKKQLREQTRQRIEMLIERGKQVYEEKCSRKSLFCTPQRKSLSLNKTESLFNKGFINNDSSKNSSDSFNYSSLSKAAELGVDINDNSTPNASSELLTRELNSFDLNSLKPEWVVDNFSDSDGAIGVQNKNVSGAENGLKDNIDQVDVKFRAINHIGNIKSKSNGTQTILKSIQTKRIQTKGPFLANVPVQQMVKNYKETESKPVNRRSISPSGLVKPLASSTPTLDVVTTTTKTPTSVQSSTNSRLSLRSKSNSFESPSTPLNVTKCIKKDSSTKLNYKDVNKSVQPCVQRPSNYVTNRRSNSSLSLFNSTANKTEIQKAFQLNKSKSEGKLSKISKPMVSNTNKISGLPVSKRCTLSSRGKENVKPQ